MQNLRVSVFAEIMHFEGVISGSFIRYRMQVTEKRNFMDIVYINCFSHSLYLSRAREIFHVSRVS